MSETEAKYYHNNSDTMVVAFGCAALRPGVPCMYGYVGVLSDHNVKKLFLKDSKKSWFLRGIVGVNDDTLKVAQSIKLFAKMMGVTRVITTGSSMGAYGALLYGIILKADVVLAFGPQTAVDPKTAKACRDGKIKHYKPHIYPYIEKYPYIKNYMDLRRRLIKWNGKTEYHTFRSTSYRMDRLQIDHIKDCPHVHVHLIPDENKQHNIASVLRGRGELQKIFASTIGGENINIMDGVNEVTQ